MKVSHELSLLKDREWSVIDGEPCRVIEFSPLSCIKEGKILGEKSLPYAVIILECKKVQEVIRGYVTNKTDFINLWKVFKERTIKENEEVIICWTKQHYKYRWLRYFSVIYPKLRILVCRKGHLEFMADPKNWQPDSGKRPSSEEMLRPIVDLKPEIMK